MISRLSMSMPKFSGKLSIANLSPLMMRSMPMSRVGGMILVNAFWTFVDSSAVSTLQASNVGSSSDLCSF